MKNWDWKDEAFLIMLICTILIDMAVVWLLCRVVK